ncbi:gas2 domain containing protein [Stylonychia lemnae]|uniref:Gas2 domain containing protein n=1 Tax=Stylonychia lemnae TaxID=5949 RepID=A0A078B2V4_STYLE|nr:gas2 domain containing protein [Stylonychia lemnae]|eukprot:CDW87552.1 gas2 domain containing protein [Stylonychia lemnae]
MAERTQTYASPTRNAPNPKDFVVIDKELIKGLTEKEVELEHLKTVIVGLNEKLKVREDLEQDLAHSRAQTQNAEQARTILHQQLEEAARRALEEAEKNKKYQDILIRQNADLGDKLIQQQGIIQGKQSEIETQRHVINGKDRELNELKHTLADFEEVKRQNQQYKRDIHDCNNSRKELQTKFENALEDHRKELEHEFKMREQLIAEKNELARKLNQAEAKIVQLENLIDTQKKMIDERDDEIARLKKLLSILDDIKRQRDQLQASLREFQEERDKLSKQIEDLVRQAQELRAKDEQHFQELMAHRKRVEDELLAKERIINEKDTMIKELTSKNLEMQQQINALESEVAVKNDLQNKLALAQELIEKISDAKERLQKELETASDYLLEQEEKTHKANLTALELLKQLKEAENEIEMLKQYVIDLKSRIAIYIPARDDIIDKKLAEYINNYPDRSKLKIMFMRESEGVYQFGSRRICVRVDKEKINIRVGGGYLSLDEFLDIYTPQELERLERKDPLKKFSEKVAIQKTLVGNEIRESSPIRSPVRGSGNSTAGLSSPMSKSNRSIRSPLKKQPSLK